MAGTGVSAAQPPGGGSPVAQLVGADVGTLVSVLPAVLCGNRVVSYSPNSPTNCVNGPEDSGNSTHSGNYHNLGNPINSGNFENANGSTGSNNEGPNSGNDTVGSRRIYVKGTPAFGAAKAADGTRFPGYGVRGSVPHRFEGGGCFKNNGNSTHSGNFANKGPAITSGNYSNLNGSANSANEGDNSGNITNGPFAPK